MSAPPNAPSSDDLPSAQPTIVGMPQAESAAEPKLAAPPSLFTLPSAGTPTQPFARPSTPPSQPRQTPSGERSALRFPPPAFVALKGEVLENAPPRLVRVRYPVEDWTLNPYGAVQDGMVAAMIDNVVAMLTYATDPLRPSSTLELSVRYFRAIRAGHVTVDGAVLRAGRTTITLECLVWDDASELCAKAMATNLFVG